MVSPSSSTEPAAVHLGARRGCRGISFAQGSCRTGSARGSDSGAASQLRCPTRRRGCGARSGSRSTRRGVATERRSSEPTPGAMLGEPMRARGRRRRSWPDRDSPPGAPEAAVAAEEAAVPQGLQHRNIAWCPMLPGACRARPAATRQEYCAEERPPGHGPWRRCTRLPLSHQASRTR